MDRSSHLEIFSLFLAKPLHCSLLSRTSASTGALSVLTKKKFVPHLAAPGLILAAEIY